MLHLNKIRITHRFYEIIFLKRIEHKVLSEIENIRIYEQLANPLNLNTIEYD